MRRISNVYLDDTFYHDQISLYDVHLMAGRKHRLRLLAYPDRQISDLVGESDAPLSFSVVGNEIGIDLSSETEKRLVMLTLSSREYDFRETYRLHIFPSFAIVDRAGVYVNPARKRQRIVLGKDGHVLLDTDDMIDSLPVFQSEGGSLDPLSLKLSLPSFRHEDADGTEFILTSTILFDPVEPELHVAVHLEAYRDGLCDSAYLVGVGDEEGIVEYERFVRAEV